MCNVRKHRLRSWGSSVGRVVIRQAPAPRHMATLSASPSALRYRNPIDEKTPDEVVVFLVETLPAGKWYHPHHMPRAVYHWLAAHMQPGTLKELLRSRPRTFAVEDSKTDDAKWKFKVIKHVLAPVVSKAVSKAVTAQAPTQATQAPAPQAPPPGTAQAVHVSPPVVSKAVTAKAPTQATHPGLMVPVPKGPPPCLTPLLGAMLPIKKPPVKAKQPLAACDAHLGRAMLAALADGRGLRQQGARAAPHPTLCVGPVTAQAPDPINTPLEAPAAPMPTRPPPEPEVPPDHDAARRAEAEQGATDLLAVLGDRALLAGPTPPSVMFERLD